MILGSTLSLCDTLVYLEFVRHLGLLGVSVIVNYMLSLCDTLVYLEQCWNQVEASFTTSRLTKEARKWPKQAKPCFLATPISTKGFFGWKGWNKV